MLPTLCTGSEGFIFPAMGKYRVWEKEELAALKIGVQRHGAGNWELIRTDPELELTLSGRSGVQIKDKWRNLVKFKHVTDAEIESCKRPRVRTVKRAATFNNGSRLGSLQPGSRPGALFGRQNNNSPFGLPIGASSSSPRAWNPGAGASSTHRRLPRASRTLPDLAVVYREDSPESPGAQEYARSQLGAAGVGGGGDSDMKFGFGYMESPSLPPTITTGGEPLSFDAVLARAGPSAPMVRRSTAPQVDFASTSALTGQQRHPASWRAGFRFGTECARRAPDPSGPYPTSVATDSHPPVSTLAFSDEQSEMMSGLRSWGNGMGFGPPRSGQAVPCDNGTFGRQAAGWSQQQQPHSPSFSRFEHHAGSSTVWQGPPAREDFFRLPSFPPRGENAVGYVGATGDQVAAGGVALPTGDDLLAGVLGDFDDATLMAGMGSMNFAEFQSNPGFRTQHSQPQQEWTEQQERPPQYDPQPEHSW